MNLFDYAKVSAKILNSMPGWIRIIDLDHKFIWANDKAVQAYGYQSLEDMIGKHYAEMKCGISERAYSVETNESLVFVTRKKETFISYHPYADGLKLLLCEKSPIINDEGLLLGLITYCTDITNYTLVDTGRFLINSMKINNNHKEQYSWHLNETSNSYQLSKRQLECLFFLLRGRTDKEIAKILELSPRTVESYIQEIKFKMHCLKRADIIEKSFNEGLQNIFPKSFLQKK